MIRLWLDDVAVNIAGSEIIVLLALFAILLEPVQPAPRVRELDVMALRKGNRAKQGKIG